MRSLYNNLNLSKKAVRGYFFNTQKDYKNNKFYKNKFFGFLLFLGFPFYLILKLLKKNPKLPKFTEIGVEEWREDSYELYYYKLKNIKRISINKNLKRELNILDFTDKKSLLKILKLYLSPKFIFETIKNRNFFEVVKLLYAYHYFNAIAKYTNIKIYISAHDLMGHILKYEILKKNSIQYILIESSIRISNMIKYKGSDIIYCYGSQQAQFYKDMTNNFQKVKEVGSIKNDKYLKNNIKIKYDVCFVEILLDCNKQKYEFYSNEAYIKLLDNFIQLAREYPNLNFLYKRRIDKLQKNITYFDDLIKQMETISNIKISYDKDSYKKIKESKIVIGNLSTLCFEAIGLNKPVLFFYYHNKVNEWFDLKNSKDIFTQNSSYEIFRDRILYYLNNPQNYDFKKYKKIYMNQVDNYFGMIQKDINENNNI